MLELKNIKKNYGQGDNIVPALKGISVSFRESEFVAVLGPSGCGKTTLLNIVGGLDRYTSGDLVINGVSTKRYLPADWDSYRNHSIGFVFQNYNLIPHLTVLGNVELALTLSGVNEKERKQRATQALEKVGLGDQINKRPNQLSGGQMQRVSIARALVNDPDIILADEPTGALDSVTSVQVSDLLKEIAQDRLVIMVTHNADLADRYATRIIRLLDGEMVGDTNPYEPETLPPEKVETPQERHKKRTSMSFITALNLSLKNLFTKKGRTFLTSFAGSIGIIGIALVLAVANGFSSYVNRLQSGTLAGFPLSVATVSTATMSDMMDNAMDMQNKTEYPKEQEVYPFSAESMMFRYNPLDEAYIDYVSKMDSSWHNSVNMGYSFGVHLMRQGENGPVLLSDAELSSANLQQILGDLDFMQAQYDIIAGDRFPTAANEIALVVDSFNQVSTATLGALGFSTAEAISFEDVLETEYRMVMNDDYYGIADGLAYTKTNVNDMWSAEQTVTLKIISVIRVKSDAPLEIFSGGLVYTEALTTQNLANCKASEIVRLQLSDSYGINKNIFTGTAFKDGTITMPGYGLSVAATKEQVYLRHLQNIGGSNVPTVINIYPKDFEAKDKIKTYLNAFNADKKDDEKILVTDMSEMVTASVGGMIDGISYVLIAFASISLIVSSIMIGIITYVSVIERTKEIGVLRSIGARKMDISRVFNAETILIGFTAGTIGVLLSALLTIPINAIVGSLVAGLNSVAILNPLHAVILVAISMVLTTISGLFPASIAARKDPVVALRSE